MKTITIKSQLTNIEKCIKFVSNELDCLKCSKNNKLNALLSLEEVLALQIKNCKKDDDITICIKKGFSGIKIKVSGKGEQVEISDIAKNLYLDENHSDEAREAFNKLIDKLTGKSLTYKRISNLNIYEINTNDNDLKSIYYTAGALVLGVIFGFILKLFVANNITNVIVDNIFTPFYSTFINALKMVVTPLVFLSIASSIADLSDLKSFGKIALKIVSVYLCTSILAIGVGFLVDFLFPIGDASLMNAITNEAGEVIEMGATTSVSLIETLVNIVPKNIVDPVINMDMLQIIFLAVMVGISTSIVGNDNYFSKFINDANKVFSQLTNLIIKLMPAAIFCSMASMTITTEFSNMAKTVAWPLVIVFGYSMMIVVYGLLIMIFLKENPFKYFKNFYPVMLTALSTSSSSATMPVTMKTCEEKLHISKRLYSFSIPLGATINMDGFCVMLVITAMYLARVYSINITLPFIVTLIITIMTISVGAPGVPGGGLICLAMLLPTIGVPAQSISLIMGFYSIADMTQTIVNVTGDSVVTYLVAKSENLIEK